MSDPDTAFNEAIADALAAVAAVDGTSTTKCSVLLHAANLTQPPARATGMAIQVQRGLRIFGIVRIPQLHLSATKEAYRKLGLLILCSVFCPVVNDITVDLDPRSNVRRLVLKRWFVSDEQLGAGYHRQPRALKFEPCPFQQAPDRPCYPLRDAVAGLYFGLEGERGGGLSVDGDFGSLVVATALGSDEAWVEFALLILNMSLSRTTACEFILEWPRPCGCGGVQVGSGYVALHLPGSPSYCVRSAY
jgi:hypothetical protein